MKPKIRYLHVGPDGTETLYAEKPSNVLTTRIERLLGYEFCKLPMITLTPGPTEQPRPVRPHGDGWAPFQFFDDGCIWRRPIKRLPK